MYGRSREVQATADVLQVCFVDPCWSNLTLKTTGTTLEKRRLLYLLLSLAEIMKLQTICGSCERRGYSRPLRSTHFWTDTMVDGWPQTFTSLATQVASRSTGFASQEPRGSSKATTFLEVCGASVLFPFFVFTILTGYFETVPYGKESIRSIYHIREFNIRKLSLVRSLWPASCQRLFLHFLSYHPLKSFYHTTGLSLLISMETIAL